MRTVYLGTSDFAVTVLARLADSRWRPALVITRPDRPKGRGRKLSPPPVATAARDLGIELDQPDSVNSDEARARIAALEPDAMLICAFGALIKEPLLSEHRMLNVHPSLLPRWRGAAPIERAVIAGDEETGVSIMVVTAGLDSGPVCAQEATPIEPTDTFATLSRRLEAIGAALLAGVLDGIADGNAAPCAEQDDALATYAEKLTAEDRRLDPSESALALDRRIRALAPHIGAYLEHEDAGGRLGVLEARPTSVTGLRAGDLALSGPLPVLATGDGALELVTVQPPGKRPMAAEDWLRGLRR